MTKRSGLLAGIFLISRAAVADPVLDAVLACSRQAGFPVNEQLTAQPKGSDRVFHNLHAPADWWRIRPAYDVAFENGSGFEFDPDDFAKYGEPVPGKPGFYRLHLATPGVPITEDAKQGATGKWMRSCITLEADYKKGDRFIATVIHAKQDARDGSCDYPTGVLKKPLRSSTPAVSRALVDELFSQALRLDEPLSNGRIRIPSLCDDGLLPHDLLFPARGFDFPSSAALGAWLQTSVNSEKFRHCISYSSPGQKKLSVHDLICAPENRTSLNQRLDQLAANRKKLIVNACNSPALPLKLREDLSRIERTFFEDQKEFEHNLQLLDGYCKAPDPHPLGSVPQPKAEHVEHKEKSGLPEPPSGADVPKKPGAPVGTAKQ